MFIVIILSLFLVLFACVIVSYCVTARNIVPRRTFRNSVPLRLRTAIFYVRQTGAKIECIITNACDTFWYRDARQAGAMRERRIADACDAIGYRDTRQAGATKERIISDACDAIGNGKTCFLFAYCILN